MPIYEYCCDQCGREFERVVLSDDEATVCPHCHSSNVKRLMSACAFSVGSTFKGTANSVCASCTPSATACSTCRVKH